MRRINNLNKVISFLICITLILVMLTSFFYGVRYLKWSLFFVKQTRLEAIQNTNQLKVLVVDSPFELVWTEDYQGFNSDLAESFARYLDVELVVDFANQFSSDNSFQPDILIGANPEQSWLQSVPIFIQHLQLVSLASAPKVEQFAQLYKHPNIKVGISQINFDKTGLQTLINASQIPQESSIWQIAQTASSTVLLLSLINQQVDYVITDSISVAIFRRVYPELTVQFNILQDQPFVWQFAGNPKDKSLLQAFQSFHQMNSTSDLLDKLAEKYFSHITDFDLVDTYRFIRSIKETLPIYQPLFKEHASTFDWRLIAAIAYQESRWNPDAKSATGVRGMMMLTRDTANYLGIKNRLDIDDSIQGGIRYLRFIMERIPETIAEDERIWFALAAYNMGIGHLWDVRDLTRERGGNPDSWNDVKQHLRLLSDEQIYPNLKYGFARGNEAFTYVENIRRYYTSLIGYFSILEQFPNGQFNNGQFNNSQSPYKSLLTK